MPGLSRSTPRDRLRAVPLWKAPDDTDVRNIEDVKMMAKFVLPPVALIACIIALVLIWLR